MDVKSETKQYIYNKRNQVNASAGQVVRKYTIPNAFVMEYEEHMDDETGVGTFYLHIKQKKDENDAVKIEGGYGE